MQRIATESDTTYMIKGEIEKIIRKKLKAMEKAAKLRDEIKVFREKI